MMANSNTIGIVGPNVGGKSPSTAGLDTPDERGLFDPPLRTGRREGPIPPPASTRPSGSQRGASLSWTLSI